MSNEAQPRVQGRLLERVQPLEWACTWWDRLALK